MWIFPLLLINWNFWICYVAETDTEVYTQVSAGTLEAASGANEIIMPTQSSVFWLRTSFKQNTLFQTVLAEYQKIVFLYNYYQHIVTSSLLIFLEFCAKGLVESLEHMKYGGDLFLLVTHFHICIPPFVW